MGNIQVKNSKYIVQVDLEQNDSILVFKVIDRKNISSKGHFLYVKRYKHFKLPAKIKKKFSTIREFYNYLMQNSQKIELTDSEVVIELDGQQIKIKFVNESQESKLFCQIQNTEFQVKQQKQKSIEKGIKIVINGSSPNPNQQIGDYSDCKITINTILSQLMKRNHPFQEPEIDNRSDLRQLIQNLNIQWNLFESKTPIIPPDMTKKKINIQEPKNLNPQENIKISKEFDTLDCQKNNIISDLAKISKDKEILQALFQSYKKEFNLTNFAQQMRIAEQNARQKSLLTLLADVSYHLNRGGNSLNSKILPAQISTKQALFSRIDHMVKQLQVLNKRNNDLQNQKKVFFCERTTNF